MIFHRDNMMYGNNHPMNEAVTPLSCSEFLEKRHQISLPARQRAQAKHKKKLDGWFRPSTESNHIKSAPKLRIFKNPNSCDDHQFIKNEVTFY